jgi:hypothetical protein
MTEHLKSNAINSIALQLDEDVYGASGDFDRAEIHQRLVEAIRAEINFLYMESIPIDMVADLMQSLWEYMDRKSLEALVAERKRDFVAF